MKTILFPSDYSEAAAKALEYAVQLAMRTHSRLLLMHIYQEPYAIVGDVPVPLMSPQETLEIEEERIRKLRVAVTESSGGKVVTETVLRSGIIRDAIIAVCAEKDVDLLVMGITGHSPEIVKVWGNVTTGTIRKSKTPVLVVPDQVRYKEIRRIALAHDRETDLSADAVELIRYFTDLFRAELLVVSVGDPLQPIAQEGLKSAGEIENSLGGLPRSIVFEKDDDIATGLHAFIRQEKCDLLIMIPHRHRSLGELFHRSITKQSVFESAVPVLTIHD